MLYQLRTCIISFFGGDVISSFSLEKNWRLLQDKAIFFSITWGKLVGVFQLWAEFSNYIDVVLEFDGSHIMMIKGGFEIATSCIGSNYPIHWAIPPYRLGGFGVHYFTTLWQEELNWVEITQILTKFSNCDLLGSRYNGSQISVTAGGFELQTSCIGSRYLSKICFLAAGVADSSASR